MRPEDSKDFVPTPRQLLLTAQRLADRPAYFVRNDTGWEPTSWTQFAAKVQQAARALVALGIQPGQAVCVLGFNRPDWVVMDHAAMMVGAVVAGIYWTSAPSEVTYILEHSQCPLLLVEDARQLAKVTASQTPPASLRHTVMMSGAEPQACSELPSSTFSQMGWEAFLALGTATHQAEVDRRLAAIGPADLGTLIYTSGTTGPAKAVMLSHHNLAWTARALAQAFESNEHDRLISYLPLAHVAEQVGTVHTPAHTGCAIYFAHSIESLGEHLKEVRPTVFFGVPRVWEKIQAGIQGKLNTATGVKAGLAKWALRTGRAWHAEGLANRKPGLLLTLQMRLARRLVHAKAHAALGLDQARLLITSAAPISPETLLFFSGLDLLLREVYGQSEVTGPTSLNLANATRIGSVGRPLAGVQVRIADDGEIMVAGDNVFAGYVGDADATEQALQDGWLHSGDLGRLDGDGYLYVNGRKKDLLITSGGKNISPANIEAELMNVALIEHAVVVGDGRHFLTALLTLKPDALAAFALKEGLPISGRLEHSALLAALQLAIDDINTRQARVATIRKFALLAEPLAIESGELTPTLKIRRNVVIERHRQLVDSLYASADK